MNLRSNILLCYVNPLDQWFSTRVPGNPRVPWPPSRGSVRFFRNLFKIWNKKNEHVIWLFKYIFNLGVPWDFFLLNGFCVAKNVEKHCSRQWWKLFNFTQKKANTVRHYKQNYSFHPTKNQTTTKEPRPCTDKPNHLTSATINLIQANPYV